MRILVTGAKGMMGTDLCKTLDLEYGKQHEFLATDIEDMDVRNLNQVATVVGKYQPDLIFHLAALTNVDQCEREPDAAYYTNTVGTQNVALVCQQHNIPMLYMSTLSVFDGTSPIPYTEFDRPNPQSHYSNSKYQGELIVRSLLSRYYITRAGWVFGGGKEDKKFVAKIIELANQRSEIKAVDDKFGSPVYTVDISRGILDLVSTNQYGIYNRLNTGLPASRYEIAKAIVEYAKIADCKVIPVSSAEFPLPAARPRMEAGRNLAGDLIGLPEMRHWRDALREYIESVLL